MAQSARWRIKNQRRAQVLQAEKSPKEKIQKPKNPPTNYITCHSPLPDWIADAGELALGVDMGAPQDSRRGILAINSNSN